jgi:hypothetical protein
VPKSFHQNITNPNCKRIKAGQKKLSYEKAARKILVKLRPGGSTASIHALKLFLAKNHKIANNSTTTKTREK